MTTLLLSMRRKLALLAILLIARKCFAYIVEKEERWDLLWLQTLDNGAGRYTQTRTLHHDSNITISVWNAVSPQPGLRLVHCHSDNFYCSKVRTISNGEENPRYIRMELVRGKHPLILHTANEGHELWLTFCPGSSTCERLKRKTLLKDIDRVRYFDMKIKHEADSVGTVVVTATFSSQDSGCDLVVMRVSLASMTILSQKYLQHTPEPFRVDKSTARPISGLDNPVLAGTALAFWDISHRRLAIMSTAFQKSHWTIADNTTGQFSNPGSWTRMVSIAEDALVVTFFDLENHSLFVTQCNPKLCRCNPPKLVDGKAFHGDISDFGAGGFPEFQLNPWDGRPVLVYFAEKTKKRGCLRVMVCHDARCLRTSIFNASCGLAGYGRDASVAFPAPGLVLVSFLDLDGHDDPTYMQTRVALFRKSKASEES